MLSALIRIMHTEENQGVQGQAAELLRAAMDPAGLEGRSREQCLGTFYEGGALEEVALPLWGDAERLSSNSSACFGIQLACELIAFAIMHHGFRAKGYVTRGNLAEPLGRLVSSGQRFMQLAPVKLLRVMVATGDDVYLRFVAKSGLLAPVLRAFRRSLQPPAIGGGLFVSSVLGLLELVRADNLRVLIDHIVRNHAAILREFGPRFRPMSGILERFRQNLENKALAAEAPPPALRAQQAQRQPQQQQQQSSASVTPATTAAAAAADVVEQPQQQTQQACDMVVPALEAGEGE